jgi:hypothetical protein
MTNENEIRELAYYLWVSEGKPRGQSERHWQLATKMVSEQKNGRAASMSTTDNPAIKGAAEPEQPDQT